MLRRIALFGLTLASAAVIASQIYVQLQLQPPQTGTQAAAGRADFAIAEAAPAPALLASER